MKSSEMNSGGGGGGWKAEAEELLGLVYPSSIRDSF